jgi:hypothetical protein
MDLTSILYNLRLPTSLHLSYPFEDHEGKESFRKLQGIVLRRIMIQINQAPGAPRLRRRLHHTNILAFILIFLLPKNKNKRKS